MARHDPKQPSALLAFGQRITPQDAFDPLVTSRGWRVESWKPTFMEASDREDFMRAQEARACQERPPLTESRHVLRDPERAICIPFQQEAEEAAPKLMVAAASELPTLYFVEWHYIDFVMSCLGNVSEAARVLGVRRSTLQRKRKKTPPSR